MDNDIIFLCSLHHIFNFMCGIIFFAILLRFPLLRIRMLFDYV